MFRMKSTPPVELRGFDKYGVVVDINDYLLPPQAFSNARNVRFTSKGVERILGHQAIFGELFGEDHDEQSVVFVFNISGINGSFWIYCSLEKAWVYEGGLATNITRQADAADVDYNVIDGRDWQGTTLGGIPILNNGVDVPQFWSALSPSQKLADLTNWPSDLRAKLIRAFGSYLFAFNINEDGLLLPKALRWSHFTDPGNIPDSWDFDDPTKDAGRLELTDDKGGEIVEAVQLGNQMCVYTTDSTHILRFVGGENIFAPDLLLKDSGALAGRCVCSFAKGTRQLALTIDDAIQHSGTKEFTSVLDDRARKYIFKEIDPITYKNSFVFDNAQTNEVWICFPTSGQIEPNLACLWDYKNNTITFRDINFSAADSGPITDAPEDEWDDDSQSWDDDQTTWSTEERKITVAVSNGDNTAYRLDVGLQFGGINKFCYVERTGLSIDGVDQEKQPKTSLQTRKQCKRVWPKIIGGQPVRLLFASQQILDGDITWTDTFLFNPVVDKYIDVVFEGLLLGYRIEWVDDKFARFEGIDFEITAIAGL